MHPGPKVATKLGREPDSRLTHRLPQAADRAAARRATRRAVFDAAAAQRTRGPPKSRKARRVGNQGKRSCLRTLLVCRRVLAQEHATTRMSEHCEHLGAAAAAPPPPPPLAEAVCRRVLAEGRVTVPTSGICAHLCAVAAAAATAAAAAAAAAARSGAGSSPVA